MSTRLERNEAGSWIVVGDTDEDLDRGIAAVERNLGRERNTRTSQQTAVAEAARESRPRGRPRKSAAADLKFQRRSGMVRDTLKFLTTLNSAKDHRMSSGDVQRLMGISEPRAVGSVATIANRCLAMVHIDPAAVYESVKTRDGRFWQGRNRLSEAIKALEQLDLGKIPNGVI